MNNWCPEVFRSVFVDRHNNNGIKVAPCCQARARVEPAETFDFYTSPYLNELRQQFEQGQKPDACEYCWKVEACGHKSRRQSAIEFFQDTQPDYEVKLQGVDYSATWACNSACIMCGPYTSSLWAQQQNLSKPELKSLGRLFRTANTVLNRIDLSQVKKVHFNGGEPMLNNEQIDLLTKLDEHGVLQDAFISYNTSGTVMPSQKIIDLWQQAGLIKLFFSIDAVGDAYEYIRWPGNWEQVCSNMLYMKENLSSNVMFGFNIAVGSYNILEIADVYHWFEQNLKHNRESDPSDFCWQFVNNFDPKQLPLRVKLAAIEQLEPITEFQGIVAYLNEHINYSEDLSWVDKLNALDITRNTNWTKSLQIAKFIKDV